MDYHNPPSMRVLSRPPAPVPSPAPATVPAPPPAPAPSLDHQPSTSSTSSQSHPPRSLEGVVVVGFISRTPNLCSQLINRVLDSNIFGSGNLDKPLFINKEQETAWLSSRRISYYHEEEKGSIFLQFCCNRCPVIHGLSDTDGSGLDTVLDQQEFEDLQGLLFMFTVCHVIIYVQEGSRFDTRILKKLRVVQAAKHALVPYVRSRATPPLSSRNRYSSSPSSRPASSTGSSPGRTSGIINRNSSAISLISGLGSHMSLFPGYCTPIILFVFIDDFLDGSNPSSNVEESTNTSLTNQPATTSSLARPNLPAKGFGSVVVLAHPASKSEGGFKKKLQSSLEAQIRFLIKKCRILSGSESIHSSSRGGVVSSAAPLFSLDASRAVMLLEKSMIQEGESLEYATDLVEDVLNGKATSDSLLNESHNPNSIKEDILMIKEFIYKQSDVLRGKGGLVTGTSSGSAAGVGMVAVAAAAAAASASAASGKTFAVPELPGLEVWMSSSQVILHGILSAKRGYLDETEFGKRKPRQRNGGPTQVEGSNSRATDPLDVAVSLLESGRGLNTKFSTLWCERALPTAKDIYLKDLPACYPTSLHEAHLGKALCAFHSMVRGAALQLFAKRLEDDCISMWKSGRQLCDAVSLTGKPCMHQRHDVDNIGSLIEADIKQHSSGYFFLHACACGRSRKLRSDPFDFESANISSSFTDCEKLLPAIQLPDGSNIGPIQSFSWSFIRIGGARYYEPSKGLLQSGFSAKQKFLLKWTIFLEKPINPIGLPAKDLLKCFATISNIDSQIELNTEIYGKKIGSTQLSSGDANTIIESQRKPTENGKFGGKKINFGRGLPTFTMKKPFSEVVAGSSATDSAFPPLQHQKQPSSVSEKIIKQNWARDKSTNEVHLVADKGSEKSEAILSVKESLNGITSNGTAGTNPFLQIGRNVVPMNISGGELVNSNSVPKHATAYVGFEHECPHGHRFLLSSDHLNELGPSYSFLEESQDPSVEVSDSYPVDVSNIGRNSSHGKGHRSLKGMAAANKMRNTDKLKEIGANGNLNVDGPVQFPVPGKDKNQRYISGPNFPNFVKDPNAEFPSISHDDGRNGFSMLNRNIPLYMSCPYCQLSKNKKDSPKIKFAGTVSQLQRIFLVTPSFPVVLAACPVVQFEASCLPQSVPDREQKLQFSLGCRVVLPPESFLALRFPFVYGIQLDDGSLHPLNAFENQPEMTAWIMKGTTLQQNDFKQMIQGSMVIWYAAGLELMESRKLQPLPYLDSSLMVHIKTSSFHGIKRGCSVYLQPRELRANGQEKLKCNHLLEMHGKKLQVIGRDCIVGSMIDSLTVVVVVSLIVFKSTGK